MIRIAEIAIVVNDEHLAQRAKDEGVGVDEIIEGLQDEFEKWINSKHRELESITDFCGWVEQCPRCETSNIKEEFSHGIKACMFYTCYGCDFKWTKNYLTKAICAGSHTEI